MKTLYITTARVGLSDEQLKNPNLMPADYLYLKPMLPVYPPIATKANGSTHNSVGRESANVVALRWFLLESFQGASH